MIISQKNTEIWNKLLSIQEYYKDNTDIFIEIDQILYMIYDRDLLPEESEDMFNEFCKDWDINPDDPLWYKNPTYDASKHTASIPNLKTPRQVSIYTVTKSIKNITSAYMKD